MESSLTPKDMAEIEYENEEEKLNEQKYICGALQSAIETIQEYLDWSEARELIVSELEEKLDHAIVATQQCEAAFAAADDRLKQFESEAPV